MSMLNLSRVVSNILRILEEEKDRCNVYLKQINENLSNGHYSLNIIENKICIKTTIEVNSAGRVQDLNSVEMTAILIFLEKTNWEVMSFSSVDSKKYQLCLYNQDVVKQIVEKFNLSGANAN